MARTGRAQGGAVLRRLAILGLVAAFAAALAPEPAAAQQTPAVERFERSRAPESLKKFVRELPPRERRRLMLRLSTLTPRQRARFAQAWDRLSDEQRAERRERLLRGEGPELALPPELERRWESLPEREREAVRDSVRDLPPGPRDRLRRALGNWEQLTPREKRKVARHLERLRRFSGERRARMERNREHWEDLDSERRSAMRKRLRAFRELPASDQEALVERRFGDRSSEERKRILEGLRQGEPPS